MEIKIKFMKPFYIVVLIVIIISAIFTIKKSFEEVDDFITETVEIYIPSKKIVSHKRDLSIDTFDYWVFSLGSKEKLELVNDININDWVVMESLHISKLEDLNYIGDENIIPSSVLYHTCYIYIYDFANDKNITNQENSITSDNCYNWCVFIYDSDEGYYYLIHQTM